MSPTADPSQSLEEASPEEDEEHQRRKDHDRHAGEGEPLIGGVERRESGKGERGGEDVGLLQRARGRPAKSFQVKTATSRPTAMMPGRAIGTTIRSRTSSRPAPSTRAASMTSLRDRAEVAREDDRRERDAHHDIRQGEPGQAVDEAQRPEDREHRHDQHVGRDDERREDEQEQRRSAGRAQSGRAHTPPQIASDKHDDHGHGGHGQGVRHRHAELAAAPRLAEVADEPAATARPTAPGRCRRSTARRWPGSTATGYSHRMASTLRTTVGHPSAAHARHSVTAAARRSRIRYSTTPSTRISASRIIAIAWA